MEQPDEIAKARIITISNKRGYKMSETLTVPVLCSDGRTTNAQNQKRGPDGRFLPSWAVESDIFEAFVAQRGNPSTTGALNHQMDLFRSIMQHERNLLLLPRGHGKTWFICYFIEYVMEFHGTSVLYLSWTDIKNQVSLWVFQYFSARGLLTAERGVTNTYKHFTLANGARFHTYSTTGREMLGFHNYVIIADDPIDMSFRERPEKERMVELIWQSTIANITTHNIGIVPKIIIIGTRKFEGDFYDFAIDMYGDTLNLFMRTPWLEDGRLLCPELWTQKQLEDKRSEIGPYMFSAEFMQEPHPKEGGVWTEDDITFIPGLEAWQKYDYCAIAVDSAWTTNETSDLTAIETVFKHRDKRTYDCFTDENGRFTFDEILERIEAQYNYITKNFPETIIVVPIESNGGGNYIIAHAATSDYNFKMAVVPVRHDKNKEVRIIGALEAAIKNGSIRFVHNIKKSELMNEILTFPHCRKYDAIDSFAMAINELDSHDNSLEGWMF